MLLCALPAHAHIVAGSKTLLGLTAEADLALRARIVAVDGLRSTAPERSGASRPGVEAKVLEVLKGRYEEPRVRFAQHGHGVAQFEPGDETLVFLIDIERSRELDALGRVGAFHWVSLQEHDDEYTLEAPGRERLLAAVRAYAAAGIATEPEERSSALHGATLLLLTSGDPRLAASALRDLALAPTLPLVTSADVPALEKLIGDPNASMGVRVGLLEELERRGLVDGPPLRLQLLSARGRLADRITAIRGAASSPSEPVRHRLIALLSDPNDNIAAAAAIALGARGNEAAIASLAAALSHDSATVRMAAIRGLGGIAAPEALLALEIAADTHPDPATRRRARAEARKRGAQTPAH